MQDRESRIRRFCDMRSSFVVGDVVAALGLHRMVIKRMLDKLVSEGLLRMSGYKNKIVYSKVEGPHAA